MCPSKVLIVGTKRICELVWQQEAAQWEHLQDCTFELLFGTPAQRVAKLNSDAQYHLINYELLPWLADEIGKEQWPYEAVIFDEISKMKSPSAVRFKKIKKPILDVPIRFGLTGTPRGNSMLGVWSQLYCTNGPSITKTYTEFKQRWFFPVDDKRLIWIPRPDSEKEIRKAARPYAYATPLETAAPEAKVNVIPVLLPKKAMTEYRKLEQELEIEFDSGDVVRALTGGVMRGKLLQISSGAVYTDDQESFVELHDAKLEALDELIDEIQGEQLLVFYRFKHELARLKKRHKVATIDEVNAWLEGEYQVIALHPASAAHGLNLHVGGCATAVWMTLPDSQELWEQGNRRLARKGQTKDVVSHILTVADTVEDRIAKSLESHGNLQNLLMEEATCR